MSKFSVEGGVWKELTPLKRAEVILTLIFGLWLALTVLAPYTLPPGSVTDLSGKVASVDNSDQISQMNPLAAGIYYLGDVNCHQLASRSYFLNDNQMPFCTRDLGIFVGLVVGMGIALFSSIKPRLAFILLGFVPMVIDGGAQLLTSYESTNLLRLITGILAGVSAAFLIHWFATGRWESISRPSGGSTRTDGK